MEIDLIAFKNGVFDFQRRFRKIRPDDNCDVTLEYDYKDLDDNITVGYDYKEFMENSNEMKEIDHLLGKIYVDTNIREVFLTFVFHYYEMIILKNNFLFFWELEITENLKLRNYFKQY